MFCPLPPVCPPRCVPTCPHVPFAAIVAHKIKPFGTDAWKTIVPHEGHAYLAIGDSGTGTSIDVMYSRGRVRSVRLWIRTSSSGEADVVDGMFFTSTTGKDVHATMLDPTYVAFELPDFHVDVEHDDRHDGLNVYVYDIRRSRPASTTVGMLAPFIRSERTRA